MPRAKFAARPKSRVVIVLFSLVVFLVSLGSVSQAADLAQKLDEYIRGAEEVWKFSGTVLVAKDGKPVLDRGYGMANYELGVPNTPEMKFLIGSITKQFTATAIMQLAEKGLLDVNDPISKYLPEYPKETGDSITVHHLLTHTSGVPSYTDNAELMGRRATKMSTEEILNSFKDKPLDFPPGGQFKYSNSGYYLLGLIVENVSGKSYEEYLQENIFDPLGMAHTGYGHHRPILPNRAAGYELDENGELVNAGYWIRRSTPTRSCHTMH
jgi:CubicO group peptidase (beta-lactamase class C family)